MGAELEYFHFFKSPEDGAGDARGGEGYFLVKGYWGCAAGWGRIFTTGLTIMELLEWGRTFSGKKVLVSRDFHSRWFLLLFKYLTVGSH